MKTRSKSSLFFLSFKLSNTKLKFLKFIFLYRIWAICCLLPLLSCFSSQVMGQSSDQNYIQTVKVRVSGLATEAAVNGVLNDKNNAQVTIQYLDGLGRPMQVVQRQGSPLGKDMIQPIAYDTLGREVRTYLPYVSGVSSGVYQPGALTDQQAFYNAPPAGVVGIPSASGQVAYSETRFESSALNRVQQQGFPGADWKIGGSHTVKQGYGFNGPNDVRLWKMTDTGAVGTTYFPKARLYTDTLTDENGNKNITYTDFEGKVLLKRVQDNSAYLSTYYVYDEVSNLRYVLPPGFTATVFSESNAAFDRYIYAYHYNGKRKVIEKKIPARGWEFMVYNRTDRLVMSQTATQRAKAPQEWTIFKFDELGRPILSGIYVHTGSAANTSYRTVQQAVVDGNSNLWESSILTGTGYTANTYPTSWSTTLSINYYDNYNFPGGTTYSYGAASTRTNGLLTGTKINVLGTSNLLLSLNFYNNKGQLEKYFSQHNLGGVVSTGNYDEVSNTYLFSEELASSTRKHFAGAGQVVQIAMRYLYDHMGRKTKTYQQMDANAEVLLSELAYNELGQVYTKSLHNGLQTTTFSYNSRGWLTGSSAPLFALQLKYNDGSVPRYNGDITEQKWGIPGSLGKSYTYSYDKLNRLTDGVSGTGNHEKEISYDVMGNILSLKRDAAVQNYTYTGNRLNSVSGGVSRTYTYDGNALTDGVNTITYNFLDLPVTLTSGGVTTTYTYDATGNKLRKVTGLAVTEYISGIQYAGSTIDFIQTEEGLTRKSGSNYLYQYDLKDHLGNSRLSFDIYNNAPREVQHDDYYPFGKAFNSWTFGQRNNYLYNSKELQTEWGRYDYGSRFYDPVVGRWDVPDPLQEDEYWAEFDKEYIQEASENGYEIDLQEARMNAGYFRFLGPRNIITVDNSAVHYNSNPYAYVLNNPINYIDPLGLDTGGVNQLKQVNIVGNNIDFNPWGPTLILLGERINYLKPVGALGSRKGSSIASWALSKALPQRILAIRTAQRKIISLVSKKLARKAGTVVLGRFLGRIVPFVGLGLTAYDAWNNKEAISVGLGAFSAGGGDYYKLRSNPNTFYMYAK